MKTTVHEKSIHPAQRLAYSTFCLGVSLVSGQFEKVPFFLKGVGRIIFPFSLAHVSYKK